MWINAECLEAQNEWRTNTGLLQGTGCPAAPSCHFLNHNSALGVKPTNMSMCLWAQLAFYSSSASLLPTHYWILKLVTLNESLDVPSKRDPKHFLQSGWYISTQCYSPQCHAWLNNLSPLLKCRENLDKHLEGLSLNSFLVNWSIL